MFITNALYYLVHTGELRSIIQWKIWHTPVHERKEEEESPTLKTCFYFLDLTSRSFSTVIQELHPELLVPIALFYLVLRGLDTVEDDMTIALDEKDPILRNFHNILEKQGWSYDGCAITEKDRELLVQFGNVTEEFTKIKTAYRTIIKDICEKMGNGMADFCKKAERTINIVDSVEDYDLYCHYVAGLVGNGLTRMFVESKLANEALASRPQLQESMGLFLQKTNIIRDVKEDLEDKRRFWPTEIWSKHVTNFEDLFKPENKTAALNCNSEMVLNALRHADQCLFYLAGIKEQSVFNFAAIPQCMAIATLDRVFRNPDIYRKNVKITKGEACKVMMESTQNLKLVCDTFLRYTRSIHSKNSARDPNFLKISIACGKIEQFIESIFPTQNPAAVLAPGDPSKLTGRAADDAARAARDAQQAKEAKEDTFYLILTVFGVVIFISAIMVFVAYMVGARFDLALQELRKGNFMKIKSPEQLEALKKGEL